MVGKGLILRWVLRNQNVGLLKCGSEQELLASCEQSNKSFVSIGGGSGIPLEGSVYSSLTLRLLMSYIYGAPILDVSRSHTTTQHSR